VPDKDFARKDHPQLTLLQVVVVFVAAMLAGAQNSVAGGGSFILFPTLLKIGLPSIANNIRPSIIANTTNTVALWPGSVASVAAYRDELRQTKQNILALAIVSVVGGLIGSVLLLGTTNATFNALLPFLMLVATLLFAFGNRLSALARANTHNLKLPPWTLSALVLTMQFVTAIYGGFFGAGIGIVMLAVLALWGMTNIHEMNGIKTVLATCINGVSVLYFISQGQVAWPDVLWMIVGAVIGGYGGARIARQINPLHVRRFITGIAVLLTIYFFAHAYLGV
jgi:uncharacterized membrane protein YfcA